MKYQYGENVSVDTDTLPPQSIDAILKRGLAHIFGNEAAAKVSAWTDRETDGTDEKPGREVTDAEKAAKKAEFQATFLKALTDGTIGSHVRGPSVDPLTAKMQSIARVQVLDVIRGAGGKTPKKSDDKVKTKAGEFTLAELVARRLANEKFAPAIKREAEKALRDRAAQAKKAAEEGADL